MVRWSGDETSRTIGVNTDVNSVGGTRNTAAKRTRLGSESSSSNGDVTGVTRGREATTTEQEADWVDMRYPCVVEYTEPNQSGIAGGGEGRVCTRRIRCRRVVVTVGLGVLKVRGSTDDSRCSSHRVSELFLWFL